MLTPGCLQLRPCFAGPDALVPRVMAFCVTGTSAVPEPRTAATATASFPGFRDGAAFAACETADGRRRRGYCCYSLVKETNGKRLKVIA